jgi:hypothetical protein
MEAVHIANDHTASDSRRFLPAEEPLNHKHLEEAVHTASDRRASESRRFPPAEEPLNQKLHAEAVHAANDHRAPEFRYATQNAIGSHSSMLN